MTWHDPGGTHSDHRSRTALYQLRSPSSVELTAAQFARTSNRGGPDGAPWVVGAATKARFQRGGSMKSIVLGIGFVLAGVGGPPVRATEPTARPSQTESPARRSMDYTRLLKQLRGAGMKAAPGSVVDQPFLSVQGRMIRIGTEDVQVFQYPDAASADAQAALVSVDGSAVGTSQVRWIGSPHLYKSGKLFVLYLGDERTVLRALDSALGRQFAGR